MKNLFESSSATEIKKRAERLGPDSERQWGAMTAAQMFAHCSAWMEMATGLTNPPRSFAGRIFGKVTKKSILGEEPIHRTMPTEKSLIMQGERGFVTEQRRLLDWVDRFSAGGPDECISHPHCFSGT